MHANVRAWFFFVGTSIESAYTFGFGLLVSVSDVSASTPNAIFFHSTPANDGSYWHFYLNLSTVFPYKLFSIRLAGVVYLSTFIRSLFKYVSIGHESLDFEFFFVMSIVCVCTLLPLTIFSFNIVVSLQLDGTFFCRYFVYAFGECRTFISLLLICVLYGSRLLFPPVWLLMWLCQLLGFLRMLLFFLAQI